MNKIGVAFFHCLALLAFATDLIANDLTIIGQVAHADGLGRISVGVMELLKNDLKINCIPTTLNSRDLSKDVNKIIKKSNKKPGTVSLFCSSIWYHSDPYLFTRLPKSKIKIAYSMLEGTAIPPEWTAILNTCFDMVVVPDHFLVDVYKNSGVTTPIFELPLGMYLDDFYQKPQRQRPSYPFVFGTTVSCDERKNFALMIQAFAEEFGNQEGVILRLNSRQGNAHYYKELIKSLGVSNIVFTHNILNKKEYLDFIDSFDCFINIAKGEGFSLCPREALSLGIPCVLANNTAQITLCNSGLVRVVPSPLFEPADYFGLFGNQQVGYYSNCHKEDVKEALRDVYTNYSHYLNLAKDGPSWVSQYNWPNLKDKYLNLVKPKNVYLGDSNIVSDEFIMTNSPELYQKYTKILKKRK